MGMSRMSEPFQATCPFVALDELDGCRMQRRLLSCKLSVLVNTIQAALLLIPLLASVTGCGSGSPAEAPFSVPLSIVVDQHSIDTNCSGCNSVNSQGSPVLQFAAAGFSGSAAQLRWSISGGDAVSGAGRISSMGEYTPPNYLTADSVQVVVTASIASNPNYVASAVLNVTPGFLQPLSPENVALGPNGTVTVTGYLSEVGGSAEIDFAVSSPAGRKERGLGSLSSTTCRRSSEVFTSCAATYNAPASIPVTSTEYVVARVGNTSSSTAIEVLLNSAGLSSSPIAHQAKSATPMQMGSSGGNNNDHDILNGRVVDCCSGTLGSLLKGSSSGEYLLSNNHVLARSDHASVGDKIIQPGLIDNNCTPNGSGGGTAAVGSLSSWLPLNSSATNVDVAIAQVVPGGVDLSGSILEMGARQADGTLSSAPPGISSSNGKGEPGQLQMKVAKSGRTTGLTCAKITAMNLDVNVDYYHDCAETQPYLSKTFTNQIAMSGNTFVDAGDSGALLVDAGNAEPVGLLFAGGTDSLGVGQAIANPVADVLNELSAQWDGRQTFAFAGTDDHEVSCLDYGDDSVTSAQARTLSEAEMERVQEAMGQAGTMVNPAAGIQGVAAGKSNDHPGEAAILVYVDENVSVSVPKTVNEVRTQVVPIGKHDAASGSIPWMNSTMGMPRLSASALGSALAVKQQYASSLMKENPAFFGVGVGQSLDNPKDAALVIYTDRKKNPSQFPQTLGGIRTRYIVMDRLHVTRSYLSQVESRSRCIPPGRLNQEFNPDAKDPVKPSSQKLD